MANDGNIEAWLNAALSKSYKLVPTGAALGVEKDDEGSALKRIGLDRGALLKLGLDMRSVDRIYRTLMVFSQGLHEVLGTIQKDPDGVVADRIWSGFCRITEILHPRGVDSISNGLRQKYEESLSSLLETQDATLCFNNDSIVAMQQQVSEALVASSASQHEARLKEHVQQAALLMTERQVLSLGEELEREREKGCVLMEENAELKAHLADTSLRLAQTEQMLQLTKDVLATAKEDLNGLKAAYKALDNATRASEEDIARLVGERERMKNKFVEERLRKETLEHDFSELKESVASRESALRTSQNMLDRALELNSSSMECIHELVTLCADAYLLVCDQDHSLLETKRLLRDGSDEKYVGLFQKLILENRRSIFQVALDLEDAQDDEKKIERACEIISNLSSEAKVINRKFLRTAVTTRVLYLLEEEQRGLEAASEVKKLHVALCAAKAASSIWFNTTASGEARYRATLFALDDKQNENLELQRKNEVLELQVAQLEQKVARLEIVIVQHAELKLRFAVVVGERDEAREELKALPLVQAELEQIKVLLLEIREQNFSLERFAAQREKEAGECRAALQKKSFALDESNMICVTLLGCLAALNEEVSFVDHDVSLKLEMLHAGTQLQQQLMNSKKPSGLRHKASNPEQYSVLLPDEKQKVLDLISCTLGLHGKIEQMLEVANSSLILAAQIEQHKEEMVALRLYIDREKGRLAKASDAMKTQHERTESLWKDEIVVLERKLAILSQEQSKLIDERRPPSASSSSAALRSPLTNSRTKLHREEAKEEEGAEQV